MKKFLLIVTVWMVGILHGQEPANENKLPKEVIQASKASNAFAIELYRQLPYNNISFSPYSISSAFSMVDMGAKGDTQKEMATLFHFPLSIEDLGNGWLWLNKFLTFYPSNASEDVRLKVANSIWVQTNFPVLPVFRDHMSKYFNGSFRFVDFKTQIDTARATINAWVKQNTYGKISEILTPNAIDASTRMVLVSALYLKAKWRNTFDPQLTSQQPFFLEDGTIRTAPLMSQTAHFPYMETADAAILEMPYVSSRKDGPQFSMLIVLPHQKEGLKELEKNLTPEMIEHWIGGVENTRAIVTIPKFKILQLTNLNDLLKKMGMGLPFSDQADFSGISGIKGLKIGNVLHKVYLSVDETGSEAAAATAVSINVTAVLEQKPPVIFQANHPFIYILFEKTTGLILFIGRVTDPTNSGD